MTYTIVHSHEGQTATATVQADSERQALEALWATYGDDKVTVYSFR